MWICLFLFGAVTAVPIDKFMNLINEEDNLEGHNVQHIIPGHSTRGFSENKNVQFSFLFAHKENELYDTFNHYVEKGVTSKGLTFSIYDDDLRNAAIALFRLLRYTSQSEVSDFKKLKKWAKDNVNDDLLDYALRLIHVFDNTNLDEKFLPPFIKKPNLFVSGDAIMKALKFRADGGEINEDVMKIYQIVHLDKNDIFINANYSMCNVAQELCIAQIKYFTEDVALNSYYYGLHLLHPFWMSDEELNEANPKHAAHYYFAHQQLYARYLLEKEHIDPNIRSIQTHVEPDYQPYLYYENGLSFPTRTSILGRNIRKDVTYLQKIDVAITECLERGIVKVGNDSWVKVTEENYMNLLAKFIRSQIDDTKTAKIIRSVFGYATNGFPIDIYNPAPSAMHHPQTALRDPVYWYLIDRVVDYFLLYTNNSKNYNLNKYETNKFTIINLDVTRISTTYDYYLINLYKSLGSDQSNNENSDYNIYARQKRLSHKPFKIILTVHSKTQSDVVIRLFLGPRCSTVDCWEMHFRFFQLDCYQHKLNEGSNIVTWTPETSSSYSSDQYFNKSVTYGDIAKNYNIFKFPENLVIPKGREDGLNLTLFVMILETEENQKDFSVSNLYMNVTKETDNRPLGFPFHKKLNRESFNENAPNYGFYNISVYHIKDSVDNTGYYSPYLY